MEQAGDVYSTQNISAQLISQIVDALRDERYGSVEIYIEDYNVVQISKRSIKKLARSAKKRFSIRVMRNGNSSQVSTRAQ